MHHYLVMALAVLAINALEKYAIYGAELEAITGDNRTLSQNLLLSKKIVHHGRVYGDIEYLRHFGTPFLTYCKLQIV
jgi:hypothetical protein